MQKKGKRKLNKKQIISFLIGLMTILILIMGSSYAYFSVEINKNSSNTIITATTEQVATASLSQGVEKLKLNLSLNNMKQSNVGNYYADDEIDYAPNKSLGYHDFATLTLSNSGQDNNIYRCSMNVNVEFDTDANSIGRVIQEDDLKIHFMIGNQNYEYDLSDYKNTGRLEQVIEIEVIGNSDKILYGYVELSNKETEQNYLAGKNFNITINTTLNNCELTGKEAVYLVNTLGSKNYYRNELYIDKIKKIEFVDYINSDNIATNEEGEPIKWDLTQTWELSTHKNRKSPAGSIIGWLEDSGDEEVPYNLYIGSEKEIYGLSLTSAFQSMHNVKTIEFNNLNTSLVTSMASSFNECTSLKFLDLSSFDTSKVTDMNTMFRMSEIKSLNLDNFNTINVTNMLYMFIYSSSIIELNVENFITKNVTNMTYMFAKIGTEKLDLSNFDTSNVIAMNCMFYGSSSLKELNISSFTTDNLKTTSYMFNSSNINNIDMRNMDLTKISEYQIMFAGNETIIVKDELNKKWVEDRLHELGRTGNVIVAN